MKFTAYNLINLLITNFLSGYKLVPILGNEIPSKIPVKDRYGLDEDKVISSKNKSPLNDRVEYLIFHTTAGNPNTTAAQIQDYFLRPKSLGGRGWSKGGYHLIIERDGTINRMYPDSKRTNGIIPKKQFKRLLSNRNTVHISYTGGIDMKTFAPKDTRTKEQIKSQLKLTKYYIDSYPTIVLGGHNQIAAKACPSFDVPTFLRENGVSEANIMQF